MTASKGINFDRNIRLSWLDEASLLVAEGYDRHALRQRLQVFLADDIPSEENRRKTAMVLGRVWSWSADLFPARHGEAVELLRQGVSLLPADPDIANDLAWRLATGADGGLRDGQEAVKLAERAQELAGNENPYVLDTLAAAYAEAGRFDEALATGRRAHELARQAGKDGLAERIAARCRLYEQGQSYRQP